MQIDLYRVYPRTPDPATPRNHPEGQFAKVDSIILGVKKE